MTWDGEGWKDGHPTSPDPESIIRPPFVTSSFVHMFVFVFVTSLARL